MSFVIRQLCLVCGLCATLCMIDTSKARAFDIDLRLGVKGALNLSGMMSASDPPANGPWLTSSPGVGGGGGIYGELHASKLLGVELDLLFESNRVFFSGSGTGKDVDFDQRASFSQLRVPLLAKLFLSLSHSVEFTAGLGPEVILGLGQSAHTSVTDNRTTLSDKNVQSAYDYLYQADAKIGAAIAVELGFAFYTLRYHIPIALRFAYNALAPTAYADRAKLDPTLHTSTFAAAESFELGLVLGFGFLIPPREPPPEAVQKGPRPDDPFAPF